MEESDQIRALKERYKLSLHDKAEILDDFVVAIKSHRLDEKTLRDTCLIEISGWLHKIAGSSGMYGYDEIALFSRSLMNDFGSAVLPVSEELEQQLVVFGQLLRTATQTEDETG